MSNMTSLDDGTITLVAVLRDARKRAPQDEAD